MAVDRRELLVSATALGLGAALPASALALAAPDLDAALASRLDRLSLDILNQQPEGATALGLDKGARAGLKSKLASHAVEAAAQSAAFCRETLNDLAAVPDARLSTPSRLNKAIVTYALELGRDGGAFDFGDNGLGAVMSESATPYVVNQMTASFAGVPEFLDSQHQIETADDAEAYLSRLSAFATLLDQDTDRVRRDVGNGVLAPDFLLSNSIGQISGMLEPTPEQSRMTQSLVARAKAKGLTRDYSAPASKIVETQVYPALMRQRQALADAASKANSDAGVWKLKDGDAYYSWLLKVGTSTALNANDIHQMGLDQNAALEARMDALLRKQGLTQGTAGERMTALGKQPQFLFSDDDKGRDEIIAYLNGCIAAVRPQLGKAFGLKLKAPVLVKRVPVDIQDGAAQGYMNSGSLDGSRPSTYYINLKSTANWPKFSLPSLTYHETIPGHAWQGAYLTESGNVPLIRNLLSGFNAYVEGWALYAEQLADEIGMYENDWAGQLGYLQALKFRAVRLVVDTGLHDMRWTREQAVAWAMANTGRTRAAMTSEIDRYCATPGQACGYKVGHTQINVLRDRAKAALGPRFDLRAFNDMVVKTGAVPLTVLGTVTEGFIANGGKG